MDLQTRKISFIQEFLRIQNEERISGFEEMLKIQKSELFSKTNSSNDIDQLNREIDQALEDSENDRVILATDLKLKFEK
ncbi:MAG TPA: hypothetical protein VLZ75_02250 [Chitinophagales bacterium]|nr:hypothetical protein [Chitinophagales bacterium]